MGKNVQGVDRFSKLTRPRGLLARGTLLRDGSRKANRDRDRNGHGNRGRRPAPTAGGRGVQPGAVERRNPAIALPRNRFEIRRRSRLLLQRTADLPDAVVQALIKLDVVVAPDVPDQLVARHDAAGMVEEILEDDCRLPLEGDHHARPAQLTLARHKCEGPE